jgi:hypothetical protein
MYATGGDSMDRFYVLMRNGEMDESESEELKGSCGELREMPRLISNCVKYHFRSKYSR